ncbi:hypothetical protein R6Q59_015396 [Mikania micrantha]|uniref:Uncharacterized protein n=1 Tax=Mikania micrantha TaxID=192012 RepID=A0A5N6PHW2_9ASTR|nr:hypothetical protein E3N88_08228 [Mikania micrantha]
MNRRNNSGGGQSSLGYLFGSDDLRQEGESKVTTSPVCMPPYGTDNKEEKSPEKAPTPPPPHPHPHLEKDEPNSFDHKYVYHVDGDKSTGFLVTGRPSTRVRSVPGGDSSLGYLFGDK